MRRLSLDEYDVRDCGYKTPCWIARGHPNSAGYPRRTINGKRTYAPRAMYEREKGKIPAGLVPDHLCSIRMCINPDHLEPVTETVNGRRSKRAKINEQIAKQILQSKRSTKWWAAKLGIAVSTVSNVRSGARWKGV